MADKRELQLVLKLKNELSTQLSKVNSSVSKLRSSVGTLGGVIAGAFTIRAVKDFAQASVEAANTQAISESKLANAISNVRGAREGDFEALKQQAAALQQVTAIGDEQIINQQALLATFQLTGDEIGELLPRILDMGAANAKTGELTADLQGATLAVGKAITSGIGILSRYGVAMTQAQVEAFDLADQTEKVSILTEILDDNFKGAAETIGNTFAGRVQRAKNNLGDLQEEVGFALMPTLESLIMGVDGATNSLNQKSDSLANLSKFIFQATHFIIGLSKGAGGAIVTAGIFAKEMFNLGKVAVAAFMDIGNAADQIFAGLRQGVAGIVKAMRGDFSGALESFKSVNIDVFQSTSDAYRQFTQDSQINSAVTKSIWEDVGASFNRAFNLEGFQPVERAAVNAYRTLQHGAQDTGAELDGTGKEVEKLKEEYVDFEDEASSSLRKLRDEHTKNLSSIREDIAATQAEIDDLNRAFSKDRSSDTQTVAEEVIATEERIADLQQQLSESTNADRRKELQDRLSAEQAALQANAGFIQSIEGAVTKARRRASLTDLERAVEDFEARRAIAQQEFNEKMTRLQTELEASQAKEQQEIASFALKESVIEELQKSATERHEALAERNFEITKNQIEAEIQLYQRLADAIAEVRGGTSSQLRGVSDIQQGSVNNVNVTLNAAGGTDTQNRDLAQQVTKEIMSRLKINTRVPI